MRRFVASLSFVLLACAPALAQQNLPPLPQPRLQTVSPCGARAGSTVEVSFTGTDMDEPEALLFSHAGMKAEPIVPPMPPMPKVDPKKPAPKPTMGTRTTPTVSKFKVQVAADVPPGSYDVRFVNKWGVSNPRTFVVGTQLEIEEKEPNNDVAAAQRCEINTTINGAINTPTDVDYYVFPGRRGQRILLHVAASSIDSKAKPAIELYDATGSRLVFNRNYSGRDALADVVLPSDADFYVRLSEFTHVAGSLDSFYRLSITTAPWIDAVYPPMVEAGKTATVTVWGRNLPGGVADPTAVCDGVVLEKITTTISAPSDPLATQRLNYSGRIDPASSSLDGFEFRVRAPSGVSNPYLITFARGPVVLEREPNDDAVKPQELPTPGEVAGRLDKRNDRDWYLINAKKGDTFFIELFGERIGTPADFVFSVKPADPKAGMIGEFDDITELLHPTQFYSRSTDPTPFKLEAKEDGKYLVMVTARDAGTEYGPRHLYRLRVTRSQPDFRLVAMPSTKNRAEGIVAGTDGQLAIDVLAWRTDGFADAIKVTAEDLPTGVTCTPQVMGPNQKLCTLVLSVAAGAAPVVKPIRVIGTATTEGKPVNREARPATIIWGVAPGNNTPTLSRLDRQLVLAVRNKVPFRVALKQTELVVKQGDKTTLNFNVARLWPEFKSPVSIQTPTLTGNQPVIPGVVFNNNQPVVVAADKTEGSGVLTISLQSVPGVYSLVLKGSAPFQFEKVAKGPKTNIGLEQPSPAISLIIVPTQTGTVQLSANPIKAAGKGELLVKITRLNGFTGEYKLKPILPAGVKGITIAEGKIPAGQDEVKLAVTLAAEVKPGAISGLAIEATSMFEGKFPVVQQGKLNTLTVTK